MPKRFVVIGAGGVGQWVLELLSRYAEYEEPESTIFIVDGDHFEPKNLARQHFEMMGNKAEVKAAELQPKYPRTNFIPVPRWVVAEIVLEEGDYEPEDKVTAAQLLEEDDIVFVTVDNFAARKVVFDAAKAYTNIDVFTGGNSDKLNGSVYHYQRVSGVETTDHPAFWHPELVEPPDKNPGELSCAELAFMEGGTQLAVANMGVAAFIMGRFYAALNGMSDGNGLSESEGFFDLGVCAAAGYDRSTGNEIPAKKKKSRIKKSTPKTVPVG